MSTLQPADVAFRDKVADSFRRQSFMRTIGARLTAVEPGYCEIELPFRGDLCQQHGYLHGGVTGALADNAAGYAAFSLMPPDSAPLTVEYKINLMAPAQGERFVARARVEKAGRTLSVVRSEVLGYQGDTAQTLAVMLATIICLQGRQDRPRPAA